MLRGHTAAQILIDESPLAAWKVPAHLGRPEPTAEQRAGSQYLRIAHHLLLSSAGDMMASHVVGYLKDPGVVMEHISGSAGGGPVVPVDGSFSCAGVPVSLLLAGLEPAFNLPGSMLAAELADTPGRACPLRGTLFITSMPDAAGIRHKLPLLVKAQLKQVAIGFWDAYENRRPASPAAAEKFDLRRKLLAELEMHRSAQPVSQPIPAMPLPPDRVIQANQVSAPW